MIWSNNNIQDLGIYNDSQLGVNSTTDEHGIKSQEYLNADGNSVLKRRQAYVETVTINGTQQQRPHFTYTYYVYDDFDNLRATIQPQGIATLASISNWNSNFGSTFLKNWCFTYQYDARHRVIAKGVPGGGNTSYIYNALDQVVATTTDKDDYGSGGRYWMISKYDKLGRLILTARVFYQASVTPAVFQANVDAQPITSSLFETRERANSQTYGYTLNGSYPQIDGYDVQKVIYYDDYDYPALSGVDHQFLPENDVASSFTRLQGLVTGHSELILQTTKWVTTKQFYDELLRPIQIREDNALGNGGISRTTLKLDFLGRPLSKVFSQSGSGQTHTMRNVYVYDRTGRIQRELQQMDYDKPSPPADVLIAKYEYNELGQLVDKKLHSIDGGANFLQSVDYRYNIRGWLTKINNRFLNPGDDGPDAQPDLFGMELKYNEDHQMPGSVPQYNGNIAEALWRTRNASTPQIMRGYSYKYDMLRRITSADYAAYEGNTWTTANTNYSVSGVTYDDNGNIISLDRKGQVSALTNNGTPAQFGDLDKLRYKYEGNQLTGVDDLVSTTTGPNPSPLPHDFEDNGYKFQTSTTGVNEYAYDTSGNLIRDDNKGITSITYNYLNLPEVIRFKSSRIIQYIYTAAGVKVSKKVIAPFSPQIITQYVNGFVYELNTNTYVTTTLFGPMSEGRVMHNPAGSAKNWKYEYHIKDQLGNLRFAFRDEGGTNQQRADAGMEPANASTEEKDFGHVAETRLRDAVHARTGDYVARLSAAEGRRQGPSITKPVQAGDSIYAEVYGRYDHDKNVAILSSGALVAGAVVAGNEPTMPNEKMAPRRKGFPFLGLSLAITPQLLKFGQANKGSVREPQAYLRCELYSRDSVLLTTRIQPLQATKADDWQQLKTGLTADSTGYVKISLINESGKAAYFDDLALRLVDPLYMQENHYDPFGLNLVGIEYSSGQDSKYQFNGEEKQEDFGLNWTHMGARFYDPQLGRWHVTDELADDESQVDFSPYAFVWNNPTVYSDPTGYMGLVQDWEDELRRAAENAHQDDPAFTVNLPNGGVTGDYDYAAEREQMDRLDDLETLDHLGQEPNQQGPNNQGPEQDFEHFKNNPPTHPDYKAPKTGHKQIKNPRRNGGQGTPSRGWLDRKGRVWVPDNHNGNHAPHWDVQRDGGGYDAVYPYAVPVAVGVVGTITVLEVLEWIGLGLTIAL